MDKYCRVCSRSDGFRLFALTTISQISDVRVDDMLIYCSQLEVTNEDRLPQQICSECLAALNVTFMFRKLCYRSDTTLRQMLKNSLTEPALEPLLAASHFETLQLLNKPDDRCSFAELTIKEERLEPDQFFNSIVEATEISEGSIDATDEAIRSDNVEDRTHLQSNQAHACKDCKYSSNSRYNFSRHLQKHQHTALKMPEVRQRRPEVQISLRKIYKCDQCGYENYHFSNFKRHQRNWKHNTFTSYKGYISPPNRPTVYTKLRRKPEDEVNFRKIYKCEECGHENTHFANFKRHQAIWNHSAFTSYRGLPKPSDKKFGRRKDRVCPHCAEKIPYSFSMAIHIQQRCSAAPKDDTRLEITIKNESISEDLPENPQLVQPQPMVSINAALQHYSTVSFSDLKKLQTEIFRTQYQCKMCHKTVKTKATLDNHVCSHEQSSEDTLKLGYIVFKCDFCDYATHKKSNFVRHHRLKCKEAAYFDESVEPNVYFSENLKRVTKDSLKIGTLRLESGEPLFPVNYPPFNEEYIGQLRPALKYVVSVSEYAYFFVLTMRGIRCCGCSMFFDDMATLTAHRETVHSPPNILTLSRRRPDEMIQQCEHCNQQFCRQDSFDYHQQLALSNKLLFCTSCELVIVSNTGWFYHCIRSHGKRIPQGRYEKVIVGEKFRCCNCDCLKPNQQELDEHLAKHHWKDNVFAEYVCDKCFKPFLSKAQLERHIELRTAKRFYRCNDRKCHMEFKLETEAINHECNEVYQSTTNDVDIDTHPIKIYCCFVNCNEQFTSSTDLQNHVDAVHNEQKEQNLSKQISKDNVCIVCNLNFSTKHDLRQHTLFKSESHAENQTYNRSNSEEIFSNEQSSSPDEISHTKTATNKCTHCDRVFATNNSLKLHVIAKHSEYKCLCKVCGKGFRRRDALKKHNLIHTSFQRFQCSRCPYKAKLRGELRAHALTHSKRHRYACRFCRKPNKTLQARRKHETKYHKILTQAATIIRNIENGSTSSESNTL